MTFTQKSRFGYGWDFATRLVNIGIWQDVWMEYVTDTELTEARIDSDYVDGNGLIRMQFGFAGASKEAVSVWLLDPERAEIARAELTWAEAVSHTFEVTEPQLWYPNGMGAQPLYRVCVQCGEVYAEYRTGIRSLRYRQNEGAPADSLPYTIWITDRRVQIKGNNKVPLWQCRSSRL